LITVFSKICSHSSNIQNDADSNESFSFSSIIVGEPNTKITVCINLVKDSLHRAKNLLKEVCDQAENEKTEKVTDFDKSKHVNI
jgi:hypothetical protein